MHTAGLQVLCVFFGSETSMYEHCSAAKVVHMEAKGSGLIVILHVQMEDVQGDISLIIIDLTSITAAELPVLSHFALIRFQLNIPQWHQDNSVAHRRLFKV